jgi:hypothetical protein
MSSPSADHEATRLGAAASRAFLRVEVLAYLVVGVAFAAVALLGVGNAAVSLWNAVQQFGEPEMLVITIDRLLLVLMVVEILHTVRDSVGLIASIRRMLVITLESSQVNSPGKWTPDSVTLFNSTMLELGVLAGLILVMVVSIYMLRHSERHAVEAHEKGTSNDNTP